MTLTPAIVAIAPNMRPEGNRRVSLGAQAPLVSVVIPVYNYAHFVLRTIESVRSQNYPNFEIVLIDDGSTDGTAELLGNMPGIRYIRQENQGLSSARNRGLEAASGKYLLFLDADDLIGRSSIRERVRVLESNSSLSFVVCRTAYFRERVLPSCLDFLHREWNLPEENSLDLALCFFNIAPPHAFLVRKEAVDCLALRFDTTLRACEDYDFWFRLALYTSPPALVRNTKVFYRRHPNSMSRSLANQSAHDAILCQRIFRAAGVGRWFALRRRADYLLPMYASSLLTARKLWETNRAAFAGFVAGHLTELGRAIRESDESVDVTLPVLPYIGLSRVSALKMFVCDRSIRMQDFQDFSSLLPSRDDCVRSLCGAWRDGHVWRSLRSFAKFDLQYLRLSPRLRKLE